MITSIIANKNDKGEDDLGYNCFISLCCMVLGPFLATITAGEIDGR